MAERAKAKAETKVSKVPAQEGERESTRRVVLQQQRVLLIPPHVSEEQLAEWFKDLKTLPEARFAAALKKGETSEAWVVVANMDGATKENAIEAHTGKPGTPDAKVGTFKAPTEKAWAGGLRLKAPAKPLVEREPID